VEDDQSNAATAIAIYERLITRDRVDAILGPYSSPFTFGNQRRVSEWWLEKHGGLVDGVEFYFRADDGTLEQLR